MIDYDKYKRNWNAPKLIADDDFAYGQVLRELPRSGVVLDYGCGTGVLSLWMSKHGVDVIPVDISKKAEQIARSVAVCSRETPDTLLMVHVLEHMEYEKFYPLNDGIDSLVIICPTIHSLVYRMKVLFTGKHKHDEDVGHLRRYDLAGLSVLLEGLGYKIERIVYMDSLLRDLIFFQWPFTHLKFIFDRPVIRKWFNRFDSWLANHKLFPASICVHAKKY